MAGQSAGMKRSEVCSELKSLEVHSQNQDGPTKPKGEINERGGMSYDGSGGRKVGKNAPVRMATKP
jgi:hypothetical protein